MALGVIFILKSPTTVNKIYINEISNEYLKSTKLQIPNNKQIPINTKFFTLLNHLLG